MNLPGVAFKTLFLLERRKVEAGGRGVVETGVDGRGGGELLLLGVEVVVEVIAVCEDERIDE